MTKRTDGNKRPGTAEKFNRRRNEVIDIAAQVFADRGYHATTIDDLVEASNLQRGGLYHYIGGKKDLLLSIHRRFLEPLLEDTRAINQADEPADVRLRQIAQALMRTIDTYRAQVTVFLHEWRVIENEPEWKEIRAGRREFEQMIEDALRDGQAAGLFRFGDLRLTVLAFLGMMNYTYQWFTRAGRATPDEIANYFCDIFLDGISVERTVRRPRKRSRAVV